MGRVRGVVPPHTHHAIQLTIGIDDVVAIQGGDGEWRTRRGIIVRPDVVHSLQVDDVAVAMLFIDPEAPAGLWLRAALREDITVVPEARLETTVTELRTLYERPFEALEVGALVRQCVQALSFGLPPRRRLDPRVSRVLERIRGSEELRISLESAAASAFLSPSRFAHLFKQQVGLPFRRYMLWRKLTRAMLAIGREGTITAAAHASDFADAAHLTRTFYQMFGMPPSVMMRGELFEIAPPFQHPSSQDSPSDRH